MTTPLAPLLVGPDPTAMYGTPEPNNPYAAAVASLGQSDYDAILPWTIQGNGLLLGLDPAVKVGAWAYAAVATDEFTGVMTNSPAAQNDQIGWDLQMAAGTWNFTLLYRKTLSYGIYTVAIDGTTVGTIDGYAASAVENNITQLAGISVATSGKHRLTFTAATKNASSSNYQLAFEGFLLRRTA